MLEFLNPRLKFPLVNLMRKLPKIIDSKPPTSNTSPIKSVVTNMSITDSFDYFLSASFGPFELREMEPRLSGAITVEKKTDACRKARPKSPSRQNKGDWIILKCVHNSKNVGIIQALNIESLYPKLYSVTSHFGFRTCLLRTIVISPIVPSFFV